MDERKAPAKKPKQKIPRKISPERLAGIALHYLERYASSSENLKRVLERRVYTSIRHHGEPDQETAAQWIDDLIVRYQEAGLLNDLAYAEVRARSLMNRGVAGRSIRMKLLEKGVDPDTIDQALEALTEEAPDPELHAAIKLARRRRLGPFADPDKREANSEKHLAAMARSGFSYDMAKRVIECDDKDELEELL
ncbi:regulatory protein RecX [Magnetovibrio sp. PR-2]|uniref:regulatory protein RecX n=1 Tax=Magnetovibrio sp. PR-2 TaxID=3120356 RepID=UPI002FCE6463